jgi:hypothetical protein
VTELPLHLSLELQNRAVVRGESILFRLVLENRGPVALSLAGIHPERAAFEIEVRPKEGGPARRATAFDRSAREGGGSSGFPIPDVSVAPGDRLATQGDVLGWIGELEPGDYEIFGRYSYEPFANVRSESVLVTVTPAAPVTVRAAGYLPEFAGPRRNVAWLHRAAEGYEVFLERESILSPRTVISCRKAARVKTPVVPCPSSHELGSGPHVVWIGDRELVIVADPENAPLERRIPLAAADAGAIEVVAAHARGDGRLEVALASSELFLGVLSIDRLEEARFARVDRSLLRPFAFSWLPEQGWIAAGVARDERTVLSATAAEAGAGTVPATEVFTAREAVWGLALARRAPARECAIFALSASRARTSLAVTRADNGKTTTRTFKAQRLAEARCLGVAVSGGELLVWLVARWNNELALLRAERADVELTTDLGRPALASEWPELIVASDGSGLFLRKIEGDRIVRVPIT